MKMERCNQPAVTDILIYRDSADLVQAVLLENGLAMEWIRPQRPGSAVRQDIILGRVDSIEPALNGAFIAIGQPENGLLPLKEAPSGLKAGQPVIVQIRRLTQPPEKGHLLTTKLQYPGLFTVFEPSGERQIIRSKARILEENLRAALTAQEMKLLQAEHDQVQVSAAGQGALPRLLLRPNEPLVQALQSWATVDLRSIQLSDIDLFNAADQFLSDRWPAMKPKLRLHAGGFDLPAVFRLSDLASEATRRKILLKNGGSIVLDQAEALLAIDVNSGQARASAPAQLRLQTNLLAAAEIARQLRLRNVAGLVVIDFIRLAEPAARDELVASFTAALSSDRSKITIGGLTKLGLFELIRQVT